MRIVRAGCALLLLNVCHAASFQFSGTFTFDSDVQTINLNLASDGPITIRTMTYGGSTSPFVPAGGFAPSLSLYDFSGSQVAYDFVGGTAIGPNCSNGTTQDPTTGFCQDATINFMGTAGMHTLLLSVQGNNGPSLLGDPFFLAAGTNFTPGPFADPGDPTGSTLRTGSWSVLVELDGTAVDGTIPEPATVLVTAFGLGVLGLRARRR